MWWTSTGLVVVSQYSHLLAFNRLISSDRERVSERGVYEKVVGRDRQRRKKGVSSTVRLGRDLAFESIEEKERTSPQWKRTR
jgi:hypothetical protein